MSAPTDTFRSKTDAELLFFVENPSFYQPELVDAARRELRRRGALPQPAAATPLETVYADFDQESPTRRPPWLLIASIALVLAVAAAGFFSLKNDAAPPARAVAGPGHLSADSLKLESVEARPLPNFDAEKNVDKELALIPATEKTKAQSVRQFQGLSRRFWRAQNPSLYLIQQAGGVTSYPIFLGQLDLVQTQWNDLYKGLVYSYDLPPTMADHLARMRVIARINRKALKELQAKAATQRPLELAGSTQLALDSAQHLLLPLQQRMGILKGH
ncbi:hypothetical protein GO988_19875 [Hymenobacter sp. HMF4947]|uniref:Uncharacterized protein n=1 Tax=Hymenobacter ginkgonis TaxID=2682976 RepID=A0A7K1TJL3_9BACT|nr:hypothetical protein [Hymenobacter ginkgonis]MVN78597.1 hypothetical protein [Hymenobacter ginkgonis]